MKVFIIDAAGGIGARLSQQLHTRGDIVTGMHRRPEQADTITSTGATATTGDLIHNSVEELAELFRGHDVVVFSAGAHDTGKENTTLIDGVGLEKAAHAAIAANVQRFILVSAFPGTGLNDNLGENFEHYMAVKKAADVYLSHSNLEWLIVRPGTLTDKQGSGYITAGLAINYGDISRDNVADFIAEAVHEPGLSRKIVELTDGDTPIDIAVKQL